MVTMSEEREETATTHFTLKNVSSGFEGRSGDVFGGLDVLERQHISHEQTRTDIEDFADLKHDDNDDDLPDKNNSRNTSCDATGSVWQRKRESELQGDGGNFIKSGSASSAIEGDICSGRKQNSSDTSRRDSRFQLGRRPAHFRRPCGRPPGRHRSQRNRIPDHGKEPQTWTYYSLHDVKGSDMSEKSNTQAALAFLDERRKLREKQEEEEMDLEGDAFDVGSAACSKGLFSFAKRKKHDKSISISDDEKPATPKDKSDNNQSTTTLINLVTPDTAEVEGTLEEEKAESASTSRKDDTTQAGFKNRKGIRRNIRARDEDVD